jgi:hypothetical protein
LDAEWPSFRSWSAFSENTRQQLQAYLGCASPATLVETVGLKGMVAVSAEAEELASLDLPILEL